MALTWEMRVMLYLNAKKQRLLRLGATTPPAGTPDPESDYAALIASPPFYGVGEFGSTTAIAAPGESILVVENTGSNAMPAVASVLHYGAATLSLSGLAAGASIQTPAPVALGEDIIIEFAPGSASGGVINLAVKVLDNDPTPGATFTIMTTQAAAL